MTAQKDVNKRMDQVEHHLDLFRKMYGRLDRDTRDRLASLEVNLKMMVDAYGELINQNKELKAKVTLLTIIHKSDLGKLNVNAETWLNPLKKQELKRSLENG
jgi:hypothetical protein